MKKKYILSSLVVLTTVALFLTSFTTINTKEVVGVKNNFLNTNTAQTHIPPVNRKVVNIPDTNFKKIILDLLREDEKNKTVENMEKYKLHVKPESETEVYEDEMELIKGIYINNYDNKYGRISDITGIEKSINLKGIFIQNTEISSIEPLRNLTQLNQINLTSNKIESIDSLVNMKNIGYLELTNNQIKDISVFEKMTYLKNIFLNKNKIENVEPLKNLKNLSFLLLDNNNIRNMSYLKDLEKIYENGGVLQINNQTITINPEENKFELGLYLNDGTKLDVEAEGLIDNNDGTYSLKDPNIGINFKYKDIFDVTINPVKEKEIVKVEEENKEVEVTTNTNDNTNNTSDINKTSTNKDGSLSSSKLPYAGTTTNILLVISIILVIIYSNKVLRKQKLINSLSKAVDKGIRK